VSGKLEGVELSQVQSDKQFMWAWISFRRHTSFYMFYASSIQLLDTQNLELRRQNKVALLSPVACRKYAKDESP
jgi:hypothetical protein